jgi:hypothetical protein
MINNILDTSYSINDDEEMILMEWLEMLQEAHIPKNNVNTKCIDAVVKF